MTLSSTNVYFQPPASLTMKYPAIVYERDSSDTTFADNDPYTTVKRWSVTVIDQNPDSIIPDKIESLPMCRFDRFYTSAGFNHTAFNLYF